MIITGLMNFSAFILNTLLAIFPDSTGFPQGVKSAITYFAGYVGIFDPLIPMSTIGTLLAYVIIFEVTIFGFNIFVWAFGHIPFVGKK